MRCSIGAAAAVALAVAPVASAQFSLSLFHNGDPESALTSAPQRDQYGGVHRFKTLLDTMRSAAGSNVLTLNGGDSFLAGPQFDASLQLPAGQRYYDSVALSAMGYDALVVGNHEFDFGPATFRRLIDDYTGAGPFVSANLDYSAEPALSSLIGSRLVRSAVRTIGGQQVAIVGATTETLPFISSPGNVVVNPILSAVQAEVNALKAGGINKIVLVTQNQALGNDAQLIAQLRDVDVVVSNGGEELMAPAGTAVVPGDTLAPTLSLGSLGSVPNQYPLLRNDADGKTVALVSGAGKYKYVSQLDLQFDANGDLITAGGQVRRVSGNAADPDAVLPDASLQASVVAPVAAHVAGLAAAKIGRSEVALEGRRNSGNLSAPSIRRTETNLGNLVADSLVWQAQKALLDAGRTWTQPMIGLQNGGGIRNDSLIPASTGPSDLNLSRLTTFDVNAFFNLVSIIPDVSASTLKSVLENAVSRVEFTDGRFAQVSGFKFSFDAALPAGSRILDVILNFGGGAEVLIIDDGVISPTAPLMTIATIDFLARGGDQYPLAGLPFEIFPVTYQQALENYIVQGLDGLVSAAQYPEGGGARPFVFVPEPASLALAGLGSMALLRRRRA